MKFALFSAIAGLLAASVRGALTPHSTSYDLFSIYAREYLTRLSDVTLHYNDLELWRSFESLVTHTEDQLATESLRGVQFVDAVSKFYDSASALGFHDLEFQFNEYPYSSPEMMYAPEAFSDLVFDVAESIVRFAGDESLGDWVKEQRLEVEDGVRKGASPTLNNIRVQQFVGELFTWNNDTQSLFLGAFFDVYADMQKLYDPVQVLIGEQPADSSSGGSGVGGSYV